MPTSEIPLETEQNARTLAKYISSLSGFRVEERYGAAYEHMGATLCDSVLQAGLNYRTVVFPRVQQLIRRWPSARTTSAFRRMLRRFDISDVLRWQHPEKPRRITELADFLAERDIEIEGHLNFWLRNDENANSLLALRGIGLKTVDYMKALVGIPSVAVDRHLRTFVGWAGLAISSYTEISATVGRAADILEINPASLDHAIWSFVSQAKGKRPAIVFGPA